MRIIGNPLHCRGGEGGGGFEVRVVGPLDADGQAGHTEAGGGQRRTHRAGVEDEVTGVRAGVDARRHQLRRLTEATEAGGVHRGGRGSVDRDDRDVPKAGPLMLGDRERAGAVQRADGSTGAAEVGARRDDEDVVPGAVERPRQRAEAGGVHAVVVRDQDAHAAPVFRRPSSRSRALSDRRKGGVGTVPIPQAIGPGPGQHSGATPGPGSGPISRLASDRTALSRRFRPPIGDRCANTQSSGCRRAAACESLRS